MKSASRKTFVQFVQKSVGLAAGGQGCCGPRPTPTSTTTDADTGDTRADDSKDSPNAPGHARPTCCGAGPASAPASDLSSKSEDRAASDAT